MSRILQQLREKYGDQLFLRTGQGLRPTPFAEAMRLRIRSLAAEAENLIDYSQEEPEAPATINKSGWEQPALMKAPPLSLPPAFFLKVSRRRKTLPSVSPASATIPPHRNGSPSILQRLRWE